MIHAGSEGSDHCRKKTCITRVARYILYQIVLCVILLQVNLNCFINFIFYILMIYFHHMSNHTYETPKEK